MICGCHRKWQQSALLNQINSSLQKGFKGIYHLHVLQQTDRMVLSVKHHQYVHVAVLGLLAAGVRAEHPRLQHRLGLEIVLNGLDHFGRHLQTDFIAAEARIKLKIEK